MKNEIPYIVIPSAGLGKRMRPVNPEIPKEMLPVGIKPVIQYAVEEAFSAGIKNIIIIINNQKEMIRRYFEDRDYRQRCFPLAAERIDSIKMVCNFIFLYQKEPLGESDAIALSEEIVGDHPLSIIYPDNIYLPSPGALNILKSAFYEYGIDTLALMEVTEKNQGGISNSGRVDIKYIKDDIFQILRFHPKGEGNFKRRFERELRTCGFSISGPHIFEYIKRARDMIKGGEFIDVPVRQLMLREKGLIGCRLSGTVFDTGNPEGYKLCLRYIRGINQIAK
jgi:UTP--glucose-1-phosphate uridylyltransferase